MIEIIAAAAVAGAGQAIRMWRNERSARDSIEHLFWSNCVERDGKIKRSCRQGFKVADLEFEINDRPDAARNRDTYYEVRVTNLAIPGASANRVRTFRFYTGNQDGKKSHANVADIGWAPHTPGIYSQRPRY